jgi:hypothetical protein
MREPGEDAGTPSEQASVTARAKGGHVISNLNATCNKFVFYLYGVGIYDLPVSVLAEGNAVKTHAEHPTGSAALEVLIFPA